MPPNLLPLPAFYREYLHSRCLDDSAIEKFKIGYTEKEGIGWLCWPVRGADGETKCWKLRSDPRLEVNGEKKRVRYDPSGVGIQLYGIGLLKLPEVIALGGVVICEGEMDAMLLVMAGIPAVTSTSGCDTFQKEWIDLFPPGCRVTIAFDADEPGRKGREKVAALFREGRPDCALSHVHFDGVAEGKEGFDVTDFFVQQKALGMEAVKEFWKLVSADVPPPPAIQKEQSPKKAPPPKPKVDEENGEPAQARYARFPAPKVKIEKEEWLRVIGEQFPRLVATTEVCGSVVAQVLIQDVTNPFALILTDRPASGKTITINFFRKLPELMYFTSDFTPASFVTSIAARSEEQLQKIDLLPKVRWKTLLVKDLAPLLSDNDDTLRKHLGMLTDILDGEGFRKESGVYGSRGYTGDYLFMFLAASTPFAPRVWKQMAGMGQRLFFLGLESKRKTIDELIGQLQGTHYQKKITICREATHEFLKGVWSSHPEGIAWDGEHDDLESVVTISALADFLSMYRGDIFVHEERWTDGRMLTHTEPRVEDASRVNQCLYNLARGHAVLSGRSCITADDLQVCVRVVLDSAPSPRPKVLRALLQAKGILTVEQVASALGMSQKTAKREMHKMCALGLCNSALMRQEAEEEAGEYQDPAGQAKTTMKMKEEFNWWFDLIKKTGMEADKDVMNVL